MVQVEESSAAVAKILLGRYAPRPQLRDEEPGRRPLTLFTGADLAGNTYWEFKDALNSGRMRRIVKYNPRTHYADVRITREFKTPRPLFMVIIAMCYCYYCGVLLRANKEQRNYSAVAPMASLRPS